MIPMCSQNISERLLPVLKKLNLPTSTEIEAERLLAACKHDKKTDGDSITVVFVEEIGQAILQKMSFAEYELLIKRVMQK